MPIRAVKLPDFLRTAMTGTVKELPLVHSTAGKNIYDIMEARCLRAVPCNVFRENLCYLFVGRPAYKWTSSAEASYWQAPLVFVLKDLAGAPIKRVHPFDTGAFQSNRIPDFLTMFPMAGFDIGPDPLAIDRLISAFFKDVEAYLAGMGFSEDELQSRYSLTAKHQEIQAIGRLLSFRGNEPGDDRIKTIEIQTEQDVSIAGGNLLGVVVPRPYLLEPELKAELEALGGQIEDYGMFPLRVENYYSEIYSAVRRITKAKHK